MLTAEKLYSVDAFWSLTHHPDHAGKRLELIEGVVVEMAPAGLKHGTIALRLGRMIGDYVDAHQLGVTTAAETGYILGKNVEGRDTVRAPDVGFIAADKLQADLPDGFAPFAPDLAVEVVSPGDSASDIHERVSDFLRYGTQIVWVVYPKTKSIVVHTVTNAQTLEADDTLDGGDVLPGFSLPLKDIFADPLA